MSEDGNDLKTAFARMEGVVTTELKHLRNDVEKLGTRLDAQAALFVPRTEFEQDKVSQDREIRDLKSNQAKAAWAIILAWLSGLGVVASLAMKKFS